MNCCAQIFLKLDAQTLMLSPGSCFIDGVVIGIPYLLKFFLKIYNYKPNPSHPPPLHTPHTFHFVLQVMTPSLHFFLIYFKYSSLKSLSYALLSNFYRIPHYLYGKRLKGFYSNWKILLKQLKKVFFCLRLLLYILVICLKAFVLSLQKFVILYSTALLGIYSFLHLSWGILFYLYLLHSFDNLVLRTNTLGGTLVLKGAL